MREMGIRDLLIYCADFRCSHMVEISGDRWPDHIRLSDIAQRFVCTACLPPRWGPMPDMAAP